LKILKKIVNDVGHDWHVRLNPTLWAYKKIIHAPIGSTPFSLMYGSKEIIPIEIEIPSLQVSLKDIVNNEEY
jgi:hypothetical protein